MRLESLRIINFRCFDSSGQVTQLGDFTCFVGPNASGKTAALLAAARMFGSTSPLRQVVASDFHLNPGESLRDQSTRSLLLECKLVFPVLEGEQVSGDAVSATFNQMIVDAPGGAPYCRVRLEAIWTDDGTADGDISQTIHWILTDSEDEATIADNRQPMHPRDRGRIQVDYVPAARDPSQQARSAPSSPLGQLLSQMSWGDAQEQLREKLGDLEAQIVALDGVKALSRHIQTAWKEVYDGSVASDFRFQALSNEPERLLRLLSSDWAGLNPGDVLSPNDLSEGHRSLFSLSLSIGLHNAQEQLRHAAVASGFREEISQMLPILRVFAVEEPENHLSPHYLGKVLFLLRKVAAQPSAQVMLTSHSPAILSRVEPDEVRYFLGHELTKSTEVLTVPLPAKMDADALKFVREAVRGFPELYFSRVVVLGEGPTEQVVLRSMFEHSGSPLDKTFVTVVPLGGRHVNHFWRLLNRLGIPDVTLLDLDCGKPGGGWERIQYVRDQLVELHAHGSDALKLTYDDGTEAYLSDKEFEGLADHGSKAWNDLQSWTKLFAEKHQVYFSSPLDADLMMIESFPDCYLQQKPKGFGPRLPDEESAEYEKMCRSLAEHIAGPGLEELLTPQQLRLLPWYKYLFLDGSKPVAHMRAVADLDATRWRKGPAVLVELLEAVKRLSSPEA